MANVSCGPQGCRCGTACPGETGPDSIEELENQSDVTRVQEDGQEIDNLPPTVGDDLTITTYNIQDGVTYYLEVWDELNVLKATITDWWKGKLTLNAEKANTLNFSVLAEDEVVAHLIPTNRILLRDRWKSIKSEFKIEDVEHIRAGDSLIIQYVTRSPDIQLCDEPVTYYSTSVTFETATAAGVDVPPGEEGRTVTVPVAATIGSILEDLFALQNQDPPVSIGRVTQAIRDYTLPFTTEKTNIMDAVLRLRDLLPSHIRGYIWFDHRCNAFCWEVFVGIPGGTIEAGKGLQTVNHKIDYSQLCNRLHIFGAGLDYDSRIKLTDPGADQEHVYYDGTTIGEYGTKTKSPIVDSRIKHPATLLKAAQRIVSETEDPPERLRLQVLDMTLIDTAGFEDASDLVVGGEYQVIDSDMSLDTTVRVVSMTLKDLGKPVPWDLQLDNGRRDLASIIRSILDQLAAPIDVNDDGRQYKNFARLYHGDEMTLGSDRYSETLAFKPGDLRYDAEDGVEDMYYRGLDEWKKFIPCYTSAGASGFPDTDVEPHAMGYATGTGGWYRRDKNNKYWEPVNRERFMLCKIIKDNTGTYNIQECDTAGDAIDTDETWYYVLPGPSCDDGLSKDDIVIVGWVPMSGSNESWKPVILMKAGLSDSSGGTMAWYVKNSSAPWTIQQKNVDDSYHGDEVTGLSVLPGHSPTLLEGQEVTIAYKRASESDSTLTAYIVNNLTIAGT